MMKKEKLIIYMDYIFFILFSMLLSWTAYNEWLPKKPMILIVQMYFSVRMFFFFVGNKKKLFISLSTLIAIAFCMFSVFWSSHPQVTISFSLNILIQSLIMMYMANKFEFKKVIKLLFISGAIICFSSYFVSILLPGKGVDQQFHVGAWQGVFTQKNNLAGVMAFYFIISFYYLLLVKKISVRAGIVLVGIAQFGLIILSKSSTGLIVLSVSFLLTLVIVLFKGIKSIILRISVLLYTALILALGISLLVVNLEMILSLFGKDLTFTGRDIIWEAGKNLIKEQWILGYGYRSTSVENSYFLNYLQSYIGFEIYSLHNGYLDVLAYIGVVGLTIVIIGFVIYIVRTSKNLYYKKPLSFLFVTFLLYILIINVQESAFIGSEFALVWCFYVYLQTHLVMLDNAFNDE